jgi:hypothetical protein
MTDTAVMSDSAAAFIAAAFRPDDYRRVQPRHVLLGPIYVASTARVAVSGLPDDYLEYPDLVAQGVWSLMDDGIVQAASVGRELGPVLYLHVCNYIASGDYTLLSEEELTSRVGFVLDIAGRFGADEVAAQRIVAYDTGVTTEVKVRAWWR